MTTWCRGDRYHFSSALISTPCLSWFVCKFQVILRQEPRQIYHPWNQVYSRVCRSRDHHNFKQPLSVISLFVPTLGETCIVASSTQVSYFVNSFNRPFPSGKSRIKGKIKHEVNVWLLLLLILHKSLCWKLYSQIWNSSMGCSRRRPCPSIYTVAQRELWWFVRLACHLWDITVGDLRRSSCRLLYLYGRHVAG